MGQFGPFLGHFRLYLINSTKVNSFKVAQFGSMDIVELHGDILQPGGQFETPGLVRSVSQLSGSILHHIGVTKHDISHSNEQETLNM